MRQIYSRSPGDDLARPGRRLGDGVWDEIKRSSWRCLDRGMVLESTASRIVELSTELCSTRQAARLAMAGHELRGIAHHLSSVVADLENEAGRLDGLTSMHTIVDDLDADSPSVAMP